MKLQRLTVMLVGMLLAGCAQNAQWVKDNGTAAEYAADQFDCEQKVVTMYGGYANMGIGHAIVAGGDLQRCMRAKGYRLERFDNSQKPNLSTGNVTDARQ